MRSKLPTVCLIALALALTVPFLLQCGYCIPNDDDFAWLSDIRAEQGAPLEITVRIAAHLYQNWQGSFLSNLIAASHPYYYGGLTALRLTLAAMAAFYFAALFFALYQLTRTLLHRPSLNATLGLFSLAAFVTAAQTPYADIFTWVPGAGAYTLQLGLCYLSAGLLLRAMRTGRTAALIGACVSAFGAMGGSLGVAAFTCYGLLLLGVCLALPGRPFRRVLIVSACAFGGALLNCLAPGNFARRTEMGVGFAPLNILGSCFASAWHYGVELCGNWPTLAALVALTAMLALARLPDAADRLLTTRKALILLPLTCLWPVVTFLPLLTGYNVSGVSEILPNRYKFVLHNAYALVLALGSAIVARALLRRLRPAARRWLAPAAAVLCVALLLTTSPNHYQPYKIARNLVGGSYALFVQEWERVYGEIASFPGEDAVVSPDIEIAWNRDLPISRVVVVNDPNYYTNQQLAEWFGKRTVRFVAR